MDCCHSRSRSKLRCGSPPCATRALKHHWNAELRGQSGKEANLRADFKRSRAEQGVPGQNFADFAARSPRNLEGERRSWSVPAP